MSSAPSPVGYEVQRRVGELLTRDGSGGVTGYKVGMTSPALRSQFGISEPLFGLMHAAGHLTDGDGLPVTGVTRPIAVECEVAVTLASDLERREGPHDVGSVTAAVEAFHVAIEIVENRFIGLNGVSPWIVVADSVLHRCYALGPGVEGLRATGVLAGELRLNGTVLTAGRSDTLWRGGPVETLTWLANKLNAQGGHLGAGEVVLCGSLGPAAWLAPGSTGNIVASIPELGSIGLRLV